MKKLWESKDIKCLCIYQRNVKTIEIEALYKDDIFIHIFWGIDWGDCVIAVKNLQNETKCYLNDGIVYDIKKVVCFYDEKYQTIILEVYLI